MGNRAEISFVFKNCIVMLCEGLADNAFFQRLCENRSLPKFDFPFPNEIRDDNGNALAACRSYLGDVWREGGGRLHRGLRRVSG